MATCHYCRRLITESYVTALGHQWHPDCFRCAACGRPIGKESFYAHEGQPYHTACYHERFSPRCAGCGRPIIGTYTTAMEKTWHPEHFVCAAGGEPIGGRTYFEKDGKAYCENHYWERFGKRCAIGGEILKDKWVINAWGDTYCDAHARGLPECYSCHRPICERLTGGGVRYADGRTMCNRCRRTAIDTVAQGQPILLQVRRTLAGLGLDLGRVETPLRLVDQTELSCRSDRDYNPHPTGMASHRWTTLNGQVIERTVEAILILHGLPREHFETVAAHELMHTYLFINGFPQLEPWIEEGLCELAEYLWLQREHTPEATYRLKLMADNNDPIYGRGFRTALRAYEQKGLSALLASVRQKGTPQ